MARVLKSGICSLGLHIPDCKNLHDLEHVPENHWLCSKVCKQRRGSGNEGMGSKGTGSMVVIQ